MSGKARIVAYANQKGGVGKSTTTMFTARAAALYHQARVLVVDMDPQGNVSTALAPEPIPADEVTIADALTPGTGVTLRDVIRPTVFDGVHLAPARSTLSVADRALTAAEFGREHRLRELLEEVAGDYDLVLIDNPPTLLGQLLVNSLTASDGAVLVTEASQWSAGGLALLGKTIAGIRSYHNPRLVITGVVVNKWRETNFAQEAEQEITEGIARHFPGVPVWLDWRIPNWIDLSEAAETGLALDESKKPKLRVLSEDVFRPMAAELLRVPA
ncbi:Soj family ATPase [Mycobacteroides abscessus subsp. abscessus]|nr:Soj family ATPase [Mycobacteroides abscessus subsp. abscessus]